MDLLIAFKVSNKPAQLQTIGFAEADLIHSPFLLPLSLFVTKNLISARFSIFPLFKNTMKDTVDNWMDGALHC